MPVKSYLAYPEKGKFYDLEQSLSQLEHCEVIVPENSKNLLVLLTETANKVEERALEERLACLSALNQLVLVAGFDNFVKPN